MATMDPRPMPICESRRAAKNLFAKRCRVPAQTKPHVFDPPNSIEGANK